MDGCKESAAKWPHIEDLQYIFHLNFILPKQQTITWFVINFQLTSSMQVLIRSFPHVYIFGQGFD